jgi:hypothetical protein
VIRAGSLGEWSAYVFRGGAMPIVMNMRWDEVTPEQYDETRDLVQWETDSPQGALFHVAWFENGHFRVLDVWETPEDFQNFVDTRLTPGTNKVGIQGQPQVEISPAHRVFNNETGVARS